MIISKYNKIVLEPHEKQFIKDNFYKMTNSELANALGLRLTKLREFAYAMGLKRMELEYWTEQQVDFLRKNYKEIGDTELAEIFEVKWFKAKGWTKKHIEKKRRYLKLKRTKAQQKKIQERNTLMGRFKICNEKMWLKRGVAEIGEKRIWFKKDDSPLVVIKQKEGFVHYNRWLWEQHNGPIPPGMNARNISNDPINFGIEDLILISDSENAKLNTLNRMPPEMKESVKLLRKIQKQYIKLTKDE